MCIWGFIFSFFSRPFEHGNMDLQKWLFVSIGFSFFALAIYIIVSFVQKYVYQKVGKWNTGSEIFIYFLFYALYSISTYFYYRSSAINGFYSFLEFMQNIIFNLFLIMTPLLFFLRMYSLKLIPQKEEKITIKGENKLDILKINKSELVCITNSQNYVEIFYLEGNEMNSKLIRSSLKKMQTDLPFLIQAHRSHLINPVHFKSWKDSSTLLLTQMEIPVSKNYKDQLLEL